ncbi:tRNA lysidine(34) synthetase TilS [Conexibacter sp. DBS9H8]|uniref:tRNA lysidine(34) synthetase TilS n=1 Tax=Conexibacter sp. DBS9H8 TaxID=2937801 RepID=UPI00200CD652|nr:tRNA lysidine(34) synthetase TilS [Conexibacter sp. DBS9H8]
MGTGDAKAVLTRDADAVTALVAAGGLLAAGRRVLVLLSGGQDSTCLLHLAVALCGPDAVRALHVNYGLRPGAEADQAQVEATCSALGVALEVVRPPARTRPGNLQAWAREVRYRAAHERAGGGDIAAGHTATDQLETVLYRLISSPSPRALAGMARRSGPLIRPLLAVTRAETARYCVERGLAVCEDPSNAEGVFVRNRIRHELVPLLTELHPGAAANVLALARRVAEEHAVVEALVSERLDGREEVGLTELAAWPPGLAAVAVQRLADAAAGGPAAGVARRLGEIVAMGPDAALDLPGGVRARTRASRLAFERTPRVDAPITSLTQSDGAHPQ